MKSVPLCAALVLAACVNAAYSQAYPSKSIRVIVPYPAGGGTDLAARFIGQKLGETFGRPVIVENRAGANGLIGTEAMAKAAPDGYTLGMATPGPVTVAKSLYPSLAYDPERDLTPVILANASPNVLAVHPSVPARSVKELVALAKTRPLHAGVSTIASVQHLLAEMLNHAAGVKMEIITYKGGAQVATDVVGGQIESLWSVLPVVLPFTQNGRLRCSPSRARNARRCYRTCRRWAKPAGRASSRRRGTASSRPLGHREISSPRSIRKSHAASKRPM